MRQIQGEGRQGGRLLGEIQARENRPVLRVVGKYNNGSAGRSQFQYNPSVKCPIPGWQLGQDGVRGPGPEYSSVRVP